MKKLVRRGTVWRLSGQTLHEEGAATKMNSNVDRGLFYFYVVEEGRKMKVAGFGID
jgi:hypothetical protein